MSFGQRTDNFPNPKEELQPAFPPGCTDSTASEADRKGSADRQNPSVPDKLWFPLWCQGQQGTNQTYPNLEDLVQMEQHYYAQGEWNKKENNINQF